MRNHIKILESELEQSIISMGVKRRSELPKVILEIEIMFITVSIFNTKFFILSFKPIDNCSSNVG